MPHRQLREQLEQLRSQVEALPVGDARKAQMQELIGQIEAELNGEQAPEASLREQLELAISSFETEHPRLTGVLNRILVTLSSMGV